jgi:hypothetical protein
MIRLHPFFICGSFWNSIDGTSGYWSKTTVPEVQYVEFIYVPKAWNTHGILLREANVGRHRPVLVDPAENQLIIITGIPEYLLWLQRRQFQAYNNRFRLSDDKRITTHFLSTYYNFSWIYLHVATVQQTFILTFFKMWKILSVSSQKLYSGWLQIYLYIIIWTFRRRRGYFSESMKLGGGGV